MTPYKWLRLCGTTVSAAMVFLFCCASLAGGIGAQSAESAIAGPSLSTAAPSPFLVAPTIPLGYAPSSVATGDLRQSGKFDLVTADYSSGKITVFLGAGKGKFAPGVEYAAGSHPGSVRVADLNGDGRPDVLVANQSEGTISVLFGNGDGSFQARQSFKVGFNPSFIATGDFDGSGRVDVAVAGVAGNLLAVFLNDGNGNLQKPVMRLLTKTPSALAAADFNHDGHTDLALANADGTVSVLLGKGAAMFRSLPDVSVATGSLSSIESGDLSRSGKIDLIVTEPGRKLVSVLMGKGDGTFASPASYPVGNEPVSTLVADVNGDGVPALVVINKSSNTFSVLGGNGDGSFKNSVDFVAGNAPLAAVAGDFYGNGHVDLAIINHSSQTVSVPLGNGDGTFKAARSYSSGVQPMSVASGTLNGGKIPALVVANYCGADSACGSAGTIAVFVADEKGEYRLSSTYAVGAGPVSVALADVNGDRKLDIVALNRLDKTATVMLGLGDGTFRQPMTFPLAGAPLAFAVGGLNKDGKLDLAVVEDCGAAKCSQPGSVEVLFGAGDGSFRSAQSYSAGYSPTSVALGDISGNKHLDIVIANRCGNDASCHSAGTGTVLIGDGTGRFTPGTEIALGNSPASIGLGRLSGSALDLVVARSTDNAVAVLRGNGDGTFKPGVPYAVGNQPGSLVVADFNGDGKPDVAVANVTDSTVSVLFGKGDGTLHSSAALPVGSGPIALTSVGGASARHAGLATANGNGVGAAPGTEFSVLPNLQPDPPLASFTLVPSPAPNSNVNDSVLLSATLTGVAPNLAPTGTVTFQSDTTALSDCTNVSITQGMAPSLVSTAHCTTQMLPAGSDSLTAFYSGDGTYDTGVGETSPGVTQTVAQLSPTLTLSPSAAAGLNTAVTFTATLSGVAITPIGPSGTVAFTVGGNPIACSVAATVNPATGVATCTTSALLAGTDVIGATYPGDGNFASAIAATINQTINKLSPTLTISPSAASNLNAAVTFTATLAGVAIAPTGPSGTVAFTVGGNPIACSVAATVNPATGVATCTTSALLAGTDVIGATYPGDGNFASAIAATINQTINKLSPTLTISPSAASNLNATVTFTATLAGVAIAPTGPSGTVAFTVGGNPIACSVAATVNPATGVATCTTSALLAGTDVIGATYPGDGNFASAIAATINQTVNKLSPTLTISPSAASNLNAAVTFTATLAGVTIAPTGPSGTVAFTVGGNPIACTVAASVNPATGVATCTTSALLAGTDVIGATYPGDGNYATATAATINQTVNKLSPTLTISPSAASNLNASVTFTATLAGVTIAPTGPSGTVAFTVGGNPIACTAAATVNPATGVATCTTSALLAGTDVIGASYPGDGNYATATAATINQTVNQLTPTLTISPSAPSNLNAAVTFTATLGGVSLAPTGPSGTVSFTVGGNPIACTAAATVNPATGVATCTTSALLAGTDVIGASYPGDSNFHTAIAATINQIVNQVTPTLTISPSAASSVNGLVTFTATLSGVSFAPTGPTGTMSFTDGGHPIACNAPATVNATTGVATCATSALLAGTDVIGATYPGDSNFKTATAATINQTVNALAASMTLTPAPGPSVPVGTSVTFTAQLTGVALTPTTPKGTVTFTINGVPNADCPPVMVTAGGAATCTTSSLVSPADVISATYAGDPNFTVASPVTIFESVGKTAPVVTVTSSLASVFVNQPVTFTATVKPASGSVLPTGSVTFSLTVGGAVLCNAVTISNVTGIATCTTSFAAAASPGSTITANYSGDANFSGLTAATAAPEVVAATSTTTAVTSSPSPSAVNQSVAFTATVTPAFAGAAKPTGSVVFTDTTTSTTLCTVTLSGGIVPVCNFTFTTSGSNNVVATYTSGDANFTGSVSPADVQGVGAGAVTVVLTSLPSPALVNQPVTFTATINTNNGSTVPQGTMTYTDTSTSTTLCTVTLTVSGNVPACPAAFAIAGTHLISAAYTSSNSNFSNGNSNVLSQPVNATSTTTSLSSLPAASGVNQSVAFTAVVTPGFIGTAKPTGSVVFTDTSTATTLCTKALVAGVVPVCNFTFTSAGNNNVVATYTSGDSNFTGSVSGVDAQVVGLTPTTTAIVSSVPSAAVNQSVTFTATITPSVAGSTNPTGHVAFTSTLNGGAPVVLCASVAVVTNANLTTAACPSAFAAGGNYTVTASYTGDANFGASSNFLLQPVGLTTTTTKVVASSSTTTVNQSVTFTSTVTPSITGATNPSGTVAFTYTLGGGVPVTLCANSAVIQATGVATCKAPLPASGSYSVKATYSGDANFGASFGIAAQTVNTTSTATTLAASPSPSTVNQAVTFTATVTPGIAPFIGSTNPSGTVTFTYTLGGGSPVTMCSTVAVNTAAEVTTAVCMVPLPTAGSYTVNAVYSGDANFVTSSGTTLQAVTSTSTSTAVVASPTPSSVNQAVTFTATVTSGIAGSINPTGSVAFSYTLGGGPSIPLCNSVTVSTLGTITTATCINTLPAQGAYTIKAAYSGDSNFQASAGTTPQTVVGTSTTTAVVSAPAPSVVNQPVTFTATVTPSVLGATNPSAGVAFTYVFNGGSPVTLCASAAVSTLGKITTASCTAPLPAAGSYTVTAAYSGDTNFGSSSNIVIQNVNPATLTIAVHSSQASSLVNVPVSFTAVLTLPFSAIATPTSTVQFRDTLTGLTLCSNVPVVNLIASCTPTLNREWTAATHPITATYNGDLNFPETTSAVFAQQVIAGATTATVVSSLGTSVATQTVTFTATVIPAQTGPVPPSGIFTFKSNGLWVPAAACQAAPVAPISSGAGAGTATASCTVSFPALAQSQTVTATYASDPNFTASSNSFAQTVQNFTVANSVTSALDATATTGPVTLTQGYATATSSAAGTDPFNATNVQLVVTSTGGFIDSLDLGCVVTNASKAVVTDPSCTIAATESGATGTALTYQVSASASAPIGVYTVSMTAIDSANPTLVKVTPLTISVVGVANILSLAQGASGTENATFNTTNAPAGANLVSFSCGTVWNLTAKTQLSASQIAGLKCTGPASVAITGSTTLVAITISTASPTTALLRETSTISLAAFLGVPLFALLGWVGSRRSPRKNFFRFLGLILLLVGVSYASGCGGSFTSTSKSTNTGIAPGSYLVQVVATDQNGNTYYAAVPLDVSAN